MRFQDGRSRRRTGLTILFVAIGLFALFSLGITGWIVWDVASGHGNAFSSGDKSSYAKCNGLDKRVRATTGTIPTAYHLIDRRYICRGYRGNTPQRVTQITYTYAADPNAGPPKEPVADYLDTELGKGGWVAPGVETINGEVTSLHLTNEPLIGLNYRVVPSVTPIFQLVVFARDQWQPAIQDKRAPGTLVVSNATVRRYNPIHYAPTFVPTGYSGWHRQQYPGSDELDPRNLTSAMYKLAGGRGEVNPEVTLSPASTDELTQLCRNNQCVEKGKTAAGKPIYSGDDGNAIYSQLGETFVEVGQLTNFNSKPQVGFAAGLKILASMQPPA